MLRRVFDRIDSVCTAPQFAFAQQCKERSANGIALGMRNHVDEKNVASSALYASACEGAGD